MLQKLITLLSVALLAVPLRASANTINVTVNQLEKVSGVDPQPPKAGSFTQSTPTPINYRISEDFKFFISGFAVPPPYDPVLGTVTGQLGAILDDGLEGGGGKHRGERSEFCRIQTWAELQGRVS